MLVQINTDNRIKGTDAINIVIQRRVRERLSRFADRATRVEMHSRDVNGDCKGGQGVEAKLKARLADWPTGNLSSSAITQRRSKALS